MDAQGVDVEVVRGRAVHAAVSHAAGPAVATNSSVTTRRVGSHPTFLLLRHAQEGCEVLP